MNKLEHVRKKTRGQQCASRAIGPAKENDTTEVRLICTYNTGTTLPKRWFQKMVSDLIDALSQINAYFLVIALFGVKFVLDAQLQ